MSAVSAAKAFEARYPQLFEFEDRGQDFFSTRVVNAKNLPPSIPLPALLREGVYLGIYVPQEIAGVDEVWVLNIAAMNYLRELGYDGEINVIGRPVVWNLA